jgi:hypothetical protein
VGEEGRGAAKANGVCVHRYIPVVAVVMFWPYVVPPIMEAVEDRW